MRKILEKCPSCESELVVTQLNCTECETVVLGRFEPNIFSRLSPDDLKFVVQFVQNKGNVKEMERESGISYWTIRNRLNDIVEQLGLARETVTETAVVAERQAILEQLDNGSIGVQEAALRLAELRS